MQINITGRNVKQTEALKDYVTKKIERLSRYLDKIINVQVKLEVEKYRHIAELKIHIEGHIFKATATDRDLYAAVDLALDKVERQISKHKEILKKHHTKAAGKRTEEEEFHKEEEIFTVVRQYEPKMSTPKQAVKEMESQSSSFYVFINTFTNKLNVTYKRVNGSTGLIELDY
ncbi:MAG: ribosomal subunit interface protein [Elusimicrobia bacterium RIFOXYA2_FULL_39_19]|nr:MAG: ribosomal subunit interface protein [Elusimicrobia bacterium RIFOXYA2_FULL_39_19]